jgi:hypothetical protein
VCEASFYFPENSATFRIIYWDFGFKRAPVTFITHHRVADETHSELANAGDVLGRLASRSDEFTRDCGFCGHIHFAADFIEGCRDHPFFVRFEYSIMKDKDVPLLPRGFPLDSSQIVRHDVRRPQIPVHSTPGTKLCLSNTVIYTMQNFDGAPHDFCVSKLAIGQMCRYPL